VQRRPVALAVATVFPKVLQEEESKTAELVLVLTMAPVAGAARIAAGQLTGILNGLLIGLEDDVAVNPYENCSAGAAPEVAKLIQSLAPMCASIGIPDPHSAGTASDDEVPDCHAVLVASNWNVCAGSS